MAAEFKYDEESICYVNSWGCMVVDRVLIERKFRNNTERLEKLFELGTRMTAQGCTPKSPPTKTKQGKSKP